MYYVLFEWSESLFIFSKIEEIWSGFVKLLVRVYILGEDRIYRDFSVYGNRDYINFVPRLPKLELSQSKNLKKFVYFFL